MVPVIAEFVGGPFDGKRVERESYPSRIFFPQPILATYFPDSASTRPIPYRDLMYSRRYPDVRPIIFYDYHYPNSKEGV